MNYESLIKQSEEKWHDIASLPGARLLKLVILRDLLSRLHVLRSQDLAIAVMDESAQIGIVEARIQELMHEPLDGDLNACMQASPLKVPAPTSLPEDLTAVIPAEKLTRIDRDWENALAREAHHLGWNFWVLDVWVSAARVEYWHKAITLRSWPRGFCLFVETAPMPEGSADAFWHGRWTMIFNPKLHHPRLLNLDFQAWPGAAIQGQHPDHYQPHWVPLLIKTPPSAIMPPREPLS